MNGQGGDWTDKENYWGFYTRGRIAVVVKGGADPVNDAERSC
ncbi:MAG: hypothetical protein M5R36_19065 [Deltaproteobacteria bacterium]|nr:hypothetical protein [Deltaproteobacteria bacterium]